MKEALLLMHWWYDPREWDVLVATNDPLDTVSAYRSFATRCRSVLVSEDWVGVILSPVVWPVPKTYFGSACHQFPMEIERTTLSIEPEDLPIISIPDLLAGDRVRVDRENNIVEIDGTKYYVPPESMDKMLDILE